MIGLPLPPSPLIDRQQMIDAARRQIRRADVRLLTLTGPPGTGKTRLALAIAAELAELFDQGAAFADLSSLKDPDQVVSAIAHAVDVIESGHQPIFAALQSALRDCHLLLVLDNFEQVIAAAPRVADLLMSCPDLKILATSRTPLRLRWEHELLVPPLGVTPSAPGADAGSAMQAPAIDLFIERTRLVQPEFQLSDTIAPIVVDICRRLDGLPLAIELAAARGRVLSPEAIQTKLHQRLRLLQDGPRDLPPRHQTLRAAIAWSEQLLGVSERVVFRRLAILVESWTIESARAIVDPDAEFGDELFDLVSTLADQSLIQSMAGSEREPRFRMLETIREYALEQLTSSDELDRVRDCQLRYLVALGERLEWEIWGPKQLAALDLIESELNNIRSALDWSLAPEGDAILGLRLAASIWRFWDARGYISEGRDWLSRLLQATPGRTSFQVKALNALGFFRFLQGEGPALLPQLEEALAISRELEEPFSLIHSLSQAGAANLFFGQPALGKMSLEEALQISRTIAHPPGIYMALFWLGQAAFLAGDPADARRLWEESLELARTQDDPNWISFVLSSLAILNLTQGNLAQAGRQQRESLSLRVRLRSQWLVSQSLEGLAVLAQAEGLAERSAFLLGAANALAERVGVAVMPDRNPFHERAVSALRAELGPERLTELEAFGRELPTDQIVSYALGEDPTIPRTIRAEPGVSDPAARLSRREREVAILVARGLTSRRIAAELVISERTADTHIDHIRAKLGLRSRIEVATWAVSAGLLAPAGE